MSKQNPGIQSASKVDEMSVLAELSPSQAAESTLLENKRKKPVIKKERLIRDSFTLPEKDYVLFASLKQRALLAGCDIKKSELLRAALSVLNALPDPDLLAALAAVERIKMGRPRK